MQLSHKNNSRSVLLIGALAAMCASPSESIQPGGIFWFVVESCTSHFCNLLVIPPFWSLFLLCFFRLAVLLLETSVNLLGINAWHHRLAALLFRF